MRSMFQNYSATIRRTSVVENGANDAAPRTAVPTRTNLVSNPMALAPVTQWKPRRRDAVHAQKGPGLRDWLRVGPRGGQDPEPK
jgi:hypothetical protein